MHRIAALAIIACAFGAAGCDRPKAPINGLGGFVLAKTTLASVANQGTGHCFDSNGRTNCLIIARQTIAERTPQIQLEFASQEPSAVLRRILMEIPGCKLDDTRAWFAERMGQPDVSDENGALWRQKFIVLSLRVTGPSRCQVVAVDPVDEPNVKLLVDSHTAPPTNQ